MANKNLRGITIEIGGDTTKLDKALKEVDKTAREATGELKEIDKALEKNPGNIDLWKQKQEVLNKELSASKEKLEKLLSVQTQMNDKLSSGEISGEQYRAYQREIENTRADIEDLQRAADSCSPALESLASKGEKLKSAGDAISGAGEKLLGVTAAVGALGTAAVKTTMSFDDSMAKVSSISGAAGEELQLLRDKAKEMGETTKFSASEAADAMQYMAMAGWKTEDMLNGVDGIMNLAAASGEDLATTSDIVTDALTALGLKAEDSAHFADILAAASSNANTNVSIMGESFKYVAPVAGSMGASAEDLSIALGLMANSGIKGSQAGNSLKNALVNLTKPTKQQAEAMQRLGFISTETIQKIDFKKVEKAEQAVEDATISLDSAQIRLNDAIAKYGENSSQAELASNNYEKTQLKLARAQETLAEEQEGVSKEIAGANTLMTDADGNMRSLGDIMGTLREKMGKVNVELTDADGNAREFDDIIGELSTTTEGLAQAEQMQAAATIFGKQNMAGMLAIINASEEDYNKLSTAIYGCAGIAEGMADTMQDTLGGQLTLLKSQLEGIAISFGEILMPTIRKIVSKIQELAEKFKGLSPETQELIVKIALVAAAVGPVLIVVGKVIAAIGTLMTWLPKIKTAMVAINAVMTANPIAVVVLAIGALVAAFVYLWKNCEEFRNFWINLWEKIKAAFQNFVKKFDKEIKTIMNTWKTMWNTMKVVYMTIFKLVLAYWKTVWNVFKTVVENFVKAFKTSTAAITAAFTLLKEKFYSIVDGLKQKFQNFKDTFISIWNAIKTFFSGIADAFSKTVSNIKNFFAGLVTYLSTTFTSAWQSAWNGIKAFFSGIADAFSKIVENIKNFFAGIITYISTTFTSAWQSAWNGIKNIFTTIFDALRTFWDNLWSKLKSVAESFVEAFRGIIENIKGVFEGMKTKFSEIIDRLKDIFSGFRDKFAEIWNSIKDHFSGVFDKFSEIGGKIKGIFSGILDNLKNVFTQGWSNAWDNIKKIFTDIWDGFKDIAKVPLNAIIGMVNSLIRGVNTMVDKMNELHVDIPDWVPSIGGKSFGINIPHVSEIPALASGGIVSGGSAVVGEAGAELLTVMNGKALVRPLMNSTANYSGQNSYTTGSNNSFTTIVNVDKISSDMDIRAIGEQLAYEQSRYLKAVGK